MPPSFEDATRTSVLDPRAPEFRAHAMKPSPIPGQRLNEFISHRDLFRIIGKLNAATGGRSDRPGLDTFCECAVAHLSLLVAQDVKFDYSNNSDEFLDGVFQSVWSRLSLGASV